MRARSSMLRHLARRLSTSPARADAIVIGAGPAGIASVGHLISHDLRVLWVDDDGFGGGAIKRYRDVPANTKVDVLNNMGGPEYLPNGLPPSASAVLDKMNRTAYPLNMKHDPATIGWTGLDQCHDFFAALTDSLKSHPNCDTVAGRVDTLQRDSSKVGAWRARLHGAAADDFSLTAPSVILATGATPHAAPADIQHPRVLPQEAALQLPSLRALVEPTDTVGIVGANHTGMVVAMHLVEQLGIRTTRLFVRRPIRLAQWDPMDGCYGNWAFRGLKGEAARFAIEHELVGTDPPNGPIGPSATGGSSSLELYDARRLYEDAGKSCDALVFCLGFGPPPLPTILARDGERISVAAHEVPGGGLRDASGKRIRGLFGVGLGFSDAEYTSGSGYAEAGFMPFAVRAGEIAEAVALRTPL